jgi:hypothetical protein
MWCGGSNQNFEYYLDDTCTWKEMQFYDRFIKA